MKKYFTGSLIVVLGSLCSVALARVDQDVFRDADVLCGGVGEDERPVLQAMRGGDALQLVFSTQGSGEYLADVAVVVQKNSSGQSLSFLASGPLCYLKLQPGSYRIQATFHGAIRTQSVRIAPQKIRMLYFYWPVDEGK